MIRGGDLISLYYNQGMPLSDELQSLIGDAEYACPSRKYVEQDFPPYFKRCLEYFHVMDWDAQFDCEDHADAYKLFMKFAHYQTKKTSTEGIAIGCFWYMSGARAEGGGGGHGINTVVIKEDGEYKILYVEPQWVAKGKSGILELTSAEISSAWGLVF